MRIRRIPAVLLLAAACLPTGEDGYTRGLAPLADAVVQLPASAMAGQPFTLTVTTQGSSCRRVAPAEVSRAGLQADVTLYELHDPDVACDRALRAMDHVVELRLSQPGTALVRVRGQTHDNAGAAAPAVIERTVLLQ